MPRRTAHQARQTRSNLLSSALEVFSQDGCSVPTLEHIAQRAGVTRGALYFHFSDKRQLLQEVCMLTSLGAREDEGPLHAGAEPMAQLQTLIQQWVRSIENDPLRRRLLDIILHKAEWTKSNEWLRLEWDRATGACIAIFEQLLHRAALAETLVLPPGMDVRDAARSLQAALVGIVSQSLRAPGSVSLLASAAWLVQSLASKSER